MKKLLLLALLLLVVGLFFYLDLGAWFTLAQLKTQQSTLAAYRADFVADEQALPLFLAPFAEPILGAQLTNYSGRIDYEYDWSLNEAAPLL